MGLDSSRGLVGELVGLVVGSGSGKETTFWCRKKVGHWKHWIGQNMGYKKDGTDLDVMHEVLKVELDTMRILASWNLLG